jgi:hypothetical protein
VDKVVVIVDFHGMVVPELPNTKNCDLKREIMVYGTKLVAKVMSAVVSVGFDVQLRQV